MSALETIVHTESLPNEVQVAFVIFYSHFQVEVAKFLINNPTFMFQINANFSEVTALCT